MSFQSPGEDSLPSDQRCTKTRSSIASGFSPLARIHSLLTGGKTMRNKYAVIGFSPLARIHSLLTSEFQPFQAEEAKVSVPWRGFTPF